MSPKHLTQGSKLPPPTRGKIRLYSSRFCPYAQRVHLVLDAKKIPYDVVYINLSNKPDWLFEKSPLGKIPALEVEGGDVLYESLIIADYLEDIWTTHPLYPREPLQKAKDRLLIDQFGKIINTMYKLVLSTNRTYLEDHRNIILDGLSVFEKELTRRDGPFFGGHKPGMLDYMIWPWCERADLLKLFGNEFMLKKEQYKKLMDWRTLMRDDPAVKKSYINTETHIKYVQSYRAGVPDYDLEIST
ncbi:hypothetical protein FQR65_LT11704 [Abscondita terminalis]|nr:hypothetical protein FQR65_LT11704 [Abscondita terminalis]